jgi:hypothetical protein
MARRRQHDGLTDQQVSNYLKCSSKCPFCGASDIEGRSIEPAGGCMYQEIYCGVCSKEWIDIYRLVGIEQQPDPEEPEWL